MKKALLIALSLVCALSLCSCAGTADKGDTTKDGVIGDGLKADVNNGANDVRDTVSDVTGGVADGVEDVTNGVADGVDDLMGNGTANNDATGTNGAANNGTTGEINTGNATNDLAENTVRP